MAEKTSAPIANITLALDFDPTIMDIFRQNSSLDIIDYIYENAYEILFLRKYLAGSFHILEDGTIATGYIDGLPYGGRWICRLGDFIGTSGLWQLMQDFENRSKINYLQGNHRPGWVMFHSGPDLVNISFTKGRFMIVDAEEREAIAIIASCNQKRTE